jgi:hypothetical protein
MTSVAPLSTRIAAWAAPLTVARITNVPPSTSAGASVFVDVLVVSAGKVHSRRTGRRLGLPEQHWRRTRWQASETWFRGSASLFPLTHARLVRAGRLYQQLRHICLSLQPSQLGKNCGDSFPAKHVSQKLPIEYIQGGHWSSISWEVDFEVCDLPEQSAAAAATIASMAAATLVGISRWPFNQRRAVTGETSARSAKAPALQQRISQH